MGWDYYDIPHIVAFPPRHPVAQIQHACTQCSRPIEVGQRYEYIPMLVDGVFKVFKQHGPNCWEDDLPPEPEGIAE